MKIKTFLAAVCLGGICLSTVFARGGSEGGSGGSDAPYTIEVAGSTSVTPLMELLAADYAKIRSNVKININGTGSSDGIKAAAAGTSEVGMSSRELSPAEKGSGLDELVIAIDGIAVIVNSNNPLTNLTIPQIRDIYAGRINDWSQIGGGKSGKIAVVSREPGSGTRGAFEELIELKDQLVLGATEFDGTGAIKAEISRNADAIGYISLGSVDNSVKTVNIEGVAATTANVINGSYRISRPFILLTKNASSHQETKRFLEWVLSSDGQAIVKKSWISVKG
ncbi:MAG: phosphate ABC transporter substrate-binding protein [Spirochaetaceae bacterium]|jgi:phosphate transport system substrate-binding protein|nr:phosphate ABC transporter substrate-binding protein [Spirochaetaceae bacterium]